LVCNERYRFSDVSILPADGGAQPLRKTGLGLSSSAANLTDGLYDNQLIPNFQRVTICGEDASEVCSIFLIENLAIICLYYLRLYPFVLY